MTPLPTQFDGSKACSTILGAVNDHERGNITESQALSKISSGYDHLSSAELKIVAVAEALLNALTKPPFRGGGALLPFDELYPEGVELKRICQSYGYR